MVKIGYKGEMETFRIKIGDSFINRWNKKDSKEFSNEQATILLKNKDFYIVDGKVPEVKENKVTENIIEEVEIKEVKEEVFDYKTADKDKLLDFTAVHGIKADYTMSNKKLRELIKEYLNE